MKQVSVKLLVLFGIVCGIFFIAESSFAASAVTNKSSSFSTKLSKSDSKSSTTTDSALAEQIRAQRAALDARDARNVVEQKSKSAATKNTCDTNLRNCIESKCGQDYVKCATDSDTTFSDKLNSCKKNANCTAHEFTLFTNEIKEDKKQAISLSAYNKVISCGNRYNDCIITECGKKFNKCLSKSAGDKAIAACKKIATECTEADSGLTGRIGSIFGSVRTDAEKQVKADEQKLYSLREQMRNSCKTIGALFDDRSLDCVFTANFYAGEDRSTPMASKKLYAGSLFDCTPDWFGIDITTFKENAYRITREQKSASSAMMGSGIGTAVGALTSGAIGRAIDTKKAKNELEQACKKQLGKVVKNGKCEDTVALKAVKKMASVNQSTKPIQQKALTVALEAEGIPGPIASILSKELMDKKDQILSAVLDENTGTYNENVSMNALGIDISELLAEDADIDIANVDINKINNINVVKLITKAIGE